MATISAARGEREQRRRRRRRRAAPINCARGALEHRGMYRPVALELPPSDALTVADALDH